jgi:hypothetical protein
MHRLKAVFIRRSSYYHDIQVVKKLNKTATNWWAKKLWNENLVEIQGDGYWFMLNPIVDLQWVNLQMEKHLTLM